MAHTILAEGLCDRDFVGARVAEFDEFARFIDAWTPRRAARLCGVAADEIRRAARLYATGRPAMMFHGLGMTEHVQGTEGVMVLVNLALLTGNFGKPGTGVNPLRGQNNVQGAAHMGCEPKLLPGSISIDAGRTGFEKLWQQQIPQAHGLHQLEMMDAALAGRLKGLWTIGYDLFLSNPNAAETARALGAPDLVIVQDLFLTETAREFGTVFLPACSSFEKDGTFMNSERRIQRVRKMLEPAGDSRSDWEIISGLARAMGRHDGFQFNGPEAIWNEIRAGCEGARGMTYARLDRAGLQWPCPSEDHPGTPILHRDAFPVGRARLQTIDYAASPEQTGTEYPFLLTTGRSLYQFNAGTMSGRTLNSELRPADLLDIAPADAAGLNLRNGQVVRLVSRFGSTTLPVHIDSAIGIGQLFATFHTAKSFLNRVTGPHRDGVVGTPEYKVVAVRIEPLHSIS
jgi:formate dehydrogenase major subunit